MMIESFTSQNVRKHLDINLKKWSVYATRRILDPAIPMIAKECSIILNNKERPPTRRELLTGVRNRDAILCTLSDKIDRRVMDVAGSTLRVISSYSNATRASRSCLLSPIDCSINSVSITPGATAFMTYDLCKPRLWQ